MSGKTRRSEGGSRGLYGTVEVAAGRCSSEVTAYAPSYTGSCPLPPPSMPN